MKEDIPIDKNGLPHKRFDSKDFYYIRALALVLTQAY